MTERGNDRTILKGLEKVGQCPSHAKMLLHLLREMVLEAKMLRHPRTLEFIHCEDRGPFRSWYS